MSRKPIKCFFCGEDTFSNLRLTNGEPHPRMRTVDHLHPRSKNGGSCGVGGLPNTVIACHACNQEKGSLSYLEYLEKRGVINRQRRVAHA